MIPLLLTTFILIPTYLNVYAYQKAIMGSHDQVVGGAHHHDDHDKHDGHDDHDHETMHNNDTHGDDDEHHHPTGGCCCNRQCMVDTLVGKDTTSFKILIKDVCDVLKTYRQSRSVARKKILNAIKKNSDGFTDLKKHINRNRRMKFSSSKNLLGSMLSNSRSNLHHDKDTEKNGETKKNHSDLHRSGEVDYEDEHEAQLLQVAEKESEWFTTEGQEKLQSLAEKLWDFCNERPGQKIDHKVPWKDMKWGLNVLFEVRNHQEGGMTDVQAMTLMHALDSDGGRFLILVLFV